MASDKALSVFEYMYRDAGNYKAFGKIVLSGAHSADDVQAIASACESQLYFIAEQVGIVPLYEQLYEFSAGPTMDDHVFHEFVTLRDHSAEDGDATGATLESLIHRFHQAAHHWNYALSPHWGFDGWS